MNRRIRLLVTGLAVLVYSFLVVAHTVWSWDIGFRCIFNRAVCLVTGTDWPGQAPQVGDQVVQIGRHQVQTYLDFVKVVQMLQRVEPEHVLSAGASGDTSRGLRELVHSTEVGGPTDVQIGGVRYVRTLLRRGDRMVAAWGAVGPIAARNFWVSFVWLILELGIFGTGAGVFWRRPDDRSAAYFFELCIFTVGAFIGGFHWWMLVDRPELIFPFPFFAMMLPAVSLHFYLTFPRPKQFVERHPTATLWIARSLPIACTIIMLGLMASVSWLYRVVGAEERTIAWIEWLLTVIKRFAVAYVVISSVLFAACLGCLVHSLRVARKAAEKNQVKWVLFGGALATIPVAYTLYLGVADPVRFALGGATAPMFLASLFFTLAFAVSIMRYRLMQVGEIINRSVLYVSISSAVALLYYASVVLGSLWWGSQLQSRPSVQSLVVIATVIVSLVGVGWGLDRFRAAIERRFYRDKGQLDRAMRKMGEAVRNLADPARVAQRMLEATADLLNLERAAVYLRSAEGDSFRLAAALGVPPELRELPMTHPVVEGLMKQSPLRASLGRVPGTEECYRALRGLGAEVAHRIEFEGRPMGLAMLGPKPLGIPFSADELSFLIALGQMTAMALDSAEGHVTIDRLSRELREKVEKISEQQRRIGILQSQLMSRQNATEKAAAPDDARTTIKGSSPVIQQTLDMARKVAASDSAVLIRGESGTGKELLAKAIHALSTRAAGPFVTVHCAALSSGLLESELFGHVKGAFTGAHRDRQGRFEMAHRGTLFLDEIGDISMETQTKLLRVLQEMAFEPVGSTRTIQVDVRIIAATHQNLEVLMREGRFREDLFYRLNVISIRTPPLRERPEDIFELAIHFLERYSRQSNKAVTMMEDDVVERLRSYSWPGNVRELENVIERAIVLADGDTLRLGDLPAELLSDGAVQKSPSDARPSRARSTSRGTTAMPVAVSAETESDEELQQLRAALAACGGNKAQAARRLGVPRSTLFSKLRKFRLI
jgi:transcriptional regulator with GAF, ATPase, and Fis domain